jgi:hypothetical protein
MSLLVKSIIVWLMFIVTESLNGTVRIFYLIPALGDPLAHQISFAIGVVLIVTTATIFIPWFQASRISQLLEIGILWLLLTAGFELVLGRFVLGYSWQQIAADYNIYQGGLMPYGLVLLTLSPIVAAKIRGILPKLERSIEAPKT